MTQFKQQQDILVEIKLNKNYVSETEIELGKDIVITLSALDSYQTPDYETKILENKQNPSLILIGINFESSLKKQSLKIEIPSHSRIQDSE